SSFVQKSVEINRYEQQQHHHHRQHYQHIHKKGRHTPPMGTSRLQAQSRRSNIADEDDYDEGDDDNDKKDLRELSQSSNKFGIFNDLLFDNIIGFVIEEQSIKEEDESAMDEENKQKVSHDISSNDFQAKCGIAAPTKELERNSRGNHQI
ncbi:hypothetical protein RFI_36449, partial [Reticulomyxa filosa]